MLQSLFVCRWLLTGGTAIPVSLIAVVPTVLEKSVFYGYLAAASVSFRLLTQFVHCCLVTDRGESPITRHHVQLSGLCKEIVLKTAIATHYKCSLCNLINAQKAYFVPRK